MYRKLIPWAWPTWILARSSMLSSMYDIRKHLSGKLWCCTQFLRPRVDSDTYWFECQLPPTVFVKENRGAMRIPFLLGMHARANIEVYTHTLSVLGHLRNISVGGCLVDVSLEESIALNMGQILPGLTIEFPNGESLHCEGVIKHMRPYGNHGQAAIGIKFSNLNSQ